MPGALGSTPDAGVSDADVLAYERIEPGRCDPWWSGRRVGQLLGGVEGLVSIVDGEVRWLVPATHCIWIPPGRPHAVHRHGDVAGWELQVAGTACRDLPRTPCIVSAGGLLGEAVNRVSTWAGGPRTDVQRRLTAVVLDEIAALRHENLGLAMPVDPHLLRVATAILDDVGDRRGLDGWAGWAHVSSRTMSRRFRAETGLTFTAWRQHARLLHALKLLAEGGQVTSIALDLGYDNVSSFISLFRRTFGVTPGRYVRDHEAYDGKCVGPTA